MEILFAPSLINNFIPGYLNGTSHLITITGGTSGLNPTEVEQLRIFIHHLIVRLYHSEHCIKSAWLHITFKELSIKIFNRGTCHKIISILEKIKLLLINPAYIVGKKSKAYKLNYFGEFKIVKYPYTFNYSKNEEKFYELFSRTKMSYSNLSEEKNNQIQLSFISKLKLNTALLQPTLRVLVNKKGKGKKGIFYLNHLAFVEYECNYFQHLKCFNLYDDFSRRYYNFFTNKPSLIRDCFLLNGVSLSSWDIKSSQIYFFTQLPNLDLSDFRVDKSKILIDDNFKKEVLNGDIYQFIANKLRINRDEAKVQLLSYFYGDKRLKKIPRLLQEYFPLTFQTLQYLKSFKVADSKFCKTVYYKGIPIHKNNYLNYILQSVERNIFLESLDGLTDFYTVHDSVYFEQGREDEFKSRILNYFFIRGLDEPMLA